MSNLISGNRELAELTDQSMFIPDSQLVELWLVLGFKDLLEDILETSVVLFQNCVLGGHVERHLLGNGHLETRVSESGNRFVSVVHGHGHTLANKVVNVHDNGFTATFRLVNELEFARTWCDEIGGSVLVAESVSADDDRLGPAWDRLGNSFQHDRFSEDGSA